MCIWWTARGSRRNGSLRHLSHLARRNAGHPQLRMNALRCDVAHALCQQATARDAHSPIIELLEIPIQSRDSQAIECRYNEPKTIANVDATLLAYPRTRQSQVTHVVIPPCRPEQSPRPVDSDLVRTLLDRQSDSRMVLAVRPNFYKFPYVLPRPRVFPFTQEVPMEQQIGIATIVL